MTQALAYEGMSAFYGSTDTDESIATIEKNLD